MPHKALRNTGLFPINDWIPAMMSLPMTFELLCYLNSSLLVSWTPDLRLALSLTHVLLLEQRRSQRPTVPAQRYPVPNLSFANKHRPLTYALLISSLNDSSHGKLSLNSSFCTFKVSLISDSYLIRWQRVPKKPESGKHRSRGDRKHFERVDGACDVPKTEFCIRLDLWIVDERGMYRYSRGCGHHAHVARQVSPPQLYHRGLSTDIWSSSISICGWGGIEYEDTTNSETSRRRK